MDREEARMIRNAEDRRIREFVLAVLSREPVTQLAPYVAEQLNVHRRWVYKELWRMVDEGILAVTGKTQRRTYSLHRMPEPAAAPPLSPIERERRMWAERKRNR